MMPAGMERLLGLRDRLVATVSPLPAEVAPLPGALGRYLAEPAHARLAAPPQTCSAMDGYAVRAADVTDGAWLTLAGARYAGDASADLSPGTAERIFTGAPLPRGADAVVREEEAEEAPGKVRFRHGARSGAHVRQAGEDVKAGGLALPSGVRLGPRTMALLTAVGLAEVVVHRKLRLTLLSTGDEVVQGHIPDSNGEALSVLCGEIGAEVVRRRAADRLEAVVDALREGLSTSDAVVSIGGVSVGERDLVPRALEALHATVGCHGVPMKPGKPFLWASQAGRLVLGLPGSPSACLAAFEVFARPALLALSGAARRHRPALRLRLAEAASGRAGRVRLLWARLEEDGRVRPLGRDTAQVLGPALSDLLIVLPSGVGDLEEGAEVTAWWLGEG
jgi:molybdopterin molybdotransferase